MSKNIAIFASGSGTNTENIINYFKNNDRVNIALIISNKKDALVIKRAEKHKIPTFILNREEFYETQNLLTPLNNYKIDLIVLAGFLWLIPNYLIRAFPDKMTNIHPALLPNYGGKGMYGKYVHEAVINAKEKESGISVHYVNERYDEGKIIFQAKCKVYENDTPESLAERLHQLEYEHYPVIIEKILGI
ncbi:MAG: phosphoribosylglycinamide formyltransferase [Bacteroidota bacterium]